LETTGEELETGGLVLETGGDAVTGFVAWSAAGFGGGGDGSLAFVATLSTLTIGSFAVIVVRTDAPASGSSFVSEGPTRLARAGGGEGALPVEGVVICAIALLEAIAGRLSDLGTSV
jgi:hypothetical protein